MSAIRINIVLFGIGNVGSKLISQILESQQFFLEKRNIELRFPVITNSTLAFFEKDGIANRWEADFQRSAFPYTFGDIISYVQEHQLDNLIAVDATNSDILIKNYIPLVQNGFDIVAANRNANTVHIDFYKELRRNLKKFDKTFHYGASVSGGLPILDTIRNLYLSGEEITKVRGVFSESLSYIFNRFSREDVSFSTLLEEAEKLKLTPSDSRLDLAAAEVAEKVLILARELGLEADYTDVRINSLLFPNANHPQLKPDFSIQKKLLDSSYQVAKLSQSRSRVLRYIGEIDLKEKTVEAKLVSESEVSPIGQLNGATTLVEIHTASNPNSPIVLQGSGSESSSVARSILTDILKVAEKIKVREAIWA